MPQENSWWLSIKIFKWSLVILKHVKLCGILVGASKIFGNFWKLIFLSLNSVVTVLTAGIKERSFQEFPLINILQKKLIGFDHYLHLCLKKDLYIKIRSLTWPGSLSDSFLPACYDLFLRYFRCLKFSDLSRIP